MEQGSATVATPGRAGAELPGACGCRRRLQVVASVVAANVPGVGLCCRSTSSAAPRGWHMEAARQKAGWRQVVNAFPRSMTVGGRAMEPTWRAALLHRRCIWSLPQPSLCMPADCRRLRSVRHLDDLHLCIRRFRHLQSTSAYALDGLSEMRTMNHMRGACSSRCARDSREIACCAERWSVPFRVQNAHTVHPEGARSVSKQVGSLSYTSVNTFKPSRNARISQISRPFI